MTKNKNLLWGILIVTALAFLYVTFPNISGSPLALTGEISSVNLVANPGFETIDTSSNYPLPWVFSNTDSTHSIAVDSSVKHTGLNSIRMTVNNSGKTWFSVMQNNVSVSEGKTYLIEFWVKSSGLPAQTGNGTGGTTGSNFYDRIAMEFREFKADGTILSTYPSLGWSGAYNGVDTNSPWELNRNKDWQRITRIYTPSIGAKNIRPAFYLYTTNGQAWFDDVRISELKDDPNLKVANPSFEAWINTYSDTSSTANTDFNTAIGWYCGQGGAICQRGTDAFDGSYSYNVMWKKSSASTWTNSYLAQDILNTTNQLIGHKYEMTAYVKANGTTYLHMQKTYGTWTDEPGSRVQYTGLNTWQKLTSTFVFTENVRHRLIVEAPAGINVFVDKVSLIDKGLATSCTATTQCNSDESCSNGYCGQVVCALGYHAENHNCVKDVITCVQGQKYDAQKQICVDSPNAINHKLIIQITLIILMGVLGIFIYKK